MLKLEEDEDEAALLSQYAVKCVLAFRFSTSNILIFFTSQMF